MHATSIREGIQYKRNIANNEIRFQGISIYSISALVQMKCETFEIYVSESSAGSYMFPRKIVSP